MYNETHLVILGTDNTCFVPMNFPHCHSNPPDWSEQEAECCCTKTSKWGIVISLNDKGVIYNFNDHLCRMWMHSQLVWVWSPGSIAPLVCVLEEWDEALFCEEFWHLTGRWVEWPQRCLACGEYAHQSSLKIKKWETKMYGKMTYNKHVNNHTW